MLKTIRDCLDRLKASLFWGWLLKIQELILFITSCVMIGILGAVVICRYVLRVDLFGYDEIVMISAFWMYFIGSSYAMEKHEHVRADILERILPPKGKKALRIFASLLQSLVAIETLNLSVAYIVNGVKIWPTTSAWGLPLMTSMSAVTVGFVVMAFYVVVQFLEEITTPLPDAAAEKGEL
ncbi:MAG: TRAP transporter small permease subunit [Synergistaceae bacterium]|nr:TRAP transporter small permease subunit [Synergistaceae bacterium]